jgi:hypothetical protein
MRRATKLLSLSQCIVPLRALTGFGNLHFHVSSVEHTNPSPAPHIGWRSDLCDQPARRENIRRASIHSLAFSCIDTFPAQSICSSQIQKAMPEYSQEYFIRSMIYCGLCASFQLTKSQCINHRCVTRAMHKKGATMKP